MDDIANVVSHKKNTHRNLLPKIFLGTVLIVIIAGLGFWEGVTYQKHHQPASVAINGSSGNFGGSFSRFSRKRVIGQVTAVNSSSITVNDRRTGASTTLAITSSTIITNNGQTVSTTDIQTGDTVIVTENSSNTSQAAAIRLNPSINGFSDGSSGAPAPTTGT